MQSLILFLTLVVTLASDLGFADSPIHLRTNSQIAQDELRFYLKDTRIQKNLDTLTNSKLTYGNKGQLLISGIMSRPVREALINSAKKSIVISVYSINSRTQGRPDSDTLKLIELLSAALARGVKVFVLVDGFTSAFTGIQPDLIKLQNLGAKVGIYQPVNSSLDSSFLVSVFSAFTKHWSQPITVDRLHEKLLLVDSRLAIVGGMNWGEAYSRGDQLTAHLYPVQFLSAGPLAKEIGLSEISNWEFAAAFGWRDTDLLIQGPVVEEIQAGFRNRWAKSLGQLPRDALSILESGEPKETRSKQRSNGLAVRYILQQPKQDKDQVQKLNTEYSEINMGYDPKCPQAYITNFYLNSIRRAKRQIVWGGHSVTPIGAVSWELINAANRGVKVFLMTNSKETAEGLPDSGKMFYSRSMCWAKFALKKTSGNLRIFEWKKNPTFKDKKIEVGSYHSKTFTVDGFLTSIGSYNIAPGSYCAYTENTLAVFDVPFTAQTEAALENDFANSIELKDPQVDDSICQTLRKNGQFLFIRGYLERAIKNMFSFL